jgi:hypothetical protein
MCKGATASARELRLNSEPGRPGCLFYWRQPAVLCSLAFKLVSPVVSVVQEDLAGPVFSEAVLTSLLPWEFYHDLTGIPSLAPCEGHLPSLCPS